VEERDDKRKDDIRHMIHQSRIEAIHQKNLRDARELLPPHQARRLDHL